MRRCSPPPDLPPLGGGAGLPPPSGGRAGEGGSHRACGAVARASRPRSQVMFISAVCAMRMTVSREHRLLEQECGETGFPHTHHPQGYGETLFPHTPLQRTRGSG